jgi:hypothetical protein
MASFLSPAGCFGMTNRPSSWSHRQRFLVPLSVEATTTRSHFSWRRRAVARAPGFMFEAETLAPREEAGFIFPRAPIRWWRGPESFEPSSLFLFNGRSRGGVATEVVAGAGLRHQHSQHESRSSALPALWPNRLQKAVSHIRQMRREAREVSPERPAAEQRTRRTMNEGDTAREARRRLKDQWGAIYER